MDTGPRIHSYEWRGGRETMLRFGPEDGPVVVLALPLFEEANRTRAFGVSILRALAAREIGGALPDLPGQGESERRTEDVSWDDLEQAYERAVDSFTSKGRRAFACGIRSGALLDGLVELSGRWHLSPQSGDDLVRFLGRLAYRSHGATSRPTDIWYRELAASLDKTATTIEVAGNLIPLDLLTNLKLGEVWTATDDEECASRTVRLVGDAAAADRHVTGRALWRRAEPDNDIALAELLAADIAEWVAACES